jgi:hypothetical protein
VQEKCPVAHGDHARTFDDFDGGAKEFRMALVNGVAREVNRHTRAVGIHDVQRGHRSARVAHGRRDGTDP